MRSSIPRHSVSFTEPEALETSVLPVAGRVTIRPYRGTCLNGTLWAARLPRLSMFELKANAMRVWQEQPREFHGLTLPLNDSFAVAEAQQVRTFELDSAHVLYPDRTFDFRTASQTSVLVANFFVDDLEDYAQRLNGEHGALRAPDASRISLASPIGSGLQRYITFVWGELSRGGGVLSSDFIAQEIEDGLIAALVWALLEEDRACGLQDEAGWADRRIARAEDYLLAHLRKPISRAELAEVAGLSMRSLSRGFAKRHGIGPMAFLKHRRLEAARADLLAAEPDSLRVSEVAFRYGFAELSSFSAAYKTIFQETPSETLRR